MSIKIELSPILYQYTNDRQVAEVNGNTVGQCLSRLVKRFTKLKLFDKDGKLFAYFRLYTNGSSVHSEALKQPVNDGDELSIMFVVGGG